MTADKPDFAGHLEARLFGMAEDHCARKGQGLRAFGAAAAEDPEFFPDLARGRSPRLKTLDKVLAELGQEPVGPFFKTEVEAFLEVTGTRISMLGRGATKNPSFVAHMKDGMSPELRTVGKVRAWMAKDMSLAHAREIRRRAGPMPEFLSDKSRRSFETPIAALLANSGNGQEPGDWDDLPFMDTEEAAALVGLAPATLQRYRVTGEGPVFYRFPERLVRYRHEDLAEWEAAGRR